MKRRNYVMLLALFMVLMCCVGAASAVSDDAMNNTISEMDSGDEAVSVSIDENTVSEIDSGDESVLKSNDEQGVDVSEEPALTAKENEKLESITIDGSTYDRVIENQIIEYEYYEFDGETGLINNCTLIDCEIDSWEEVLIKNSIVSVTYGNYKSGTLKFENSTVDGTLSNSGILIISDDTILVDTFSIKKSGTIIINDTNRILPHLSEYRDNYIIENFTFNKVIKNYAEVTLINCEINKPFNNYANAKLTLINTTVNSEIYNEGTLIISDEVIIGESGYIIGTGDIITNNTEILLKYLQNYRGNYTFSDWNFNTLKVNYGNLTIINSNITAQITNKGNFSVINTYINSRIYNEGTFIISDDTIFGEDFSLDGDGKVIINDTSKLLPYLSRLDGDYTLENYTFTKAIENYGNLTLINPKFNAKLTNYGKITIVNSTYLNEISDSNIQNQNGAYLEVINSEYINSTINFDSVNKILNSKFINNTNMDWYMPNGYVENSTFINNHKSSNDGYSAPVGGALRMEGGIVKDSIFINNSVTTTSTSVSNGASGGAIYSNKNLIVDNCTFEDNYAKSSSTWIDYQGGGAIYAALDLTVTNSKFINNYVDSPHGTVVSNDHYYEIVESGMGGAILVGKLYNTMRNVVIVNNSFEANKASIDGAAIYIKAGSEKTNITIVANNFTGNSEGQDTIFIRNYEEVVSSEGNYLRYANATTEINGNNYLSNSMNYKTFELTGPEEIYAGETADIKLEIELEHPEFYDADIMERCNYTWYVNGELITNKETEMSVQITGNYITYVTPSISNQRTKVLSIIPTVLTDIIITPENINTYLFEGELIVSPKSHLIFQGDFENIGKIYNKKNDVIFDGENATFTNTTIKIEADKNTVKNMNIKNTDTSNYTIIVSGAKNKVINNTIIQYNHDDQTAAIYNDNGEDTIISGNVINVTGPSLSITWTDGANTANTQGILSVGGANNIISYNNITVQNSTDSELALFSTMEAITAPLGENITITRNNVYVTGGRFNYGINTLTDVINNRITENNITVVGYRYTDGIQVGDGAVNNTIANNNIYLTCINSTPVDEAAISYGIIISSQGGTTSENNTIAENNIVINGIVNYGMEIYTSTNTLITGNNITLNGAKSMGIGYAHSPNSTVTGNIIRINDDSTIRINSVTEEIQPESVGIKIQQESDNVTITDNIIITNDKAKTDYTIDTGDKNTVITDNKLISSTGYGDETIKTTQTDTATSDNIIETTTSMDDIVGEINADVVLQANVTTELDTPVNGGSVVFSDADGNVLAQANVINGVAKTTITFAEPISVNITAAYTPASEGLVASEAASTLEIGKTSTNLEADDLNMTFKDGSAWTAQLTDANDNAIANTIVKVGIAGKTYGLKTNEEGIVIIPINLAPGTYEINATYEGDGQYADAFTNATITVNKIAYTLSAENLVMAYKDGSSWNVALTDGEGNPVAGVKIAVGISGKVYYIKTDDAGVAGIAINMQPGTYDINASFTSNKYEAETITATITVNKAVPTLSAEDLVMNYKDGSAWNVTLKDAAGNVMANSIVKITAKGTTYNIKTDTNGVASLPINMAAGNYSISARFEGSKYLESVEINSTIVVNPPEYNLVASDINMTYQDGTNYTVQITDGEGNNVAQAGVVIKVTIKDRSYNIKTNADGVASLPINLKAGTYEITAEYNGKQVNSTVIVNKA